MCDFVVDVNGNGTHLTLQAAVEDAVATGEEQVISILGHQTHVLGLQQAEADIDLEATGLYVEETERGLYIEKSK